MNTKEIIKSLSERLQKPEEEVTNIFKFTIETFREHLINHNYFSLPKFGTFDISERNHHKAYNPHYKKVMLIPNKVVALFRPSKALKENVT
jgi:nucleoid DNA-binding protein